MANQEHLDLLKQGSDIWNKWRDENKDTIPDLEDSDLANADLAHVHLRLAKLKGINLTGANLRGANLVEVDLRGADLSNADLKWAGIRADAREANLRGADLAEARLRNSNFNKANFVEANLRVAALDNSTFRQANLSRVNLIDAKVKETDFWAASLKGANLTRADFTGANLSFADLEGAILIETNLVNAVLSDCRTYGVSAWKLKVDGSTQKDIVITSRDEPVVTVDNLEIAQFIYLLLHNAKIRSVIDTITTKSVLILGRFTPDRKVILDAIREELRRRNYIPILFDFDKPVNRDLTETVMTLAGMARFVVADLSDPHSIPHELMSFVEKYLSVPVQPIFCPVPGHPKEYPMIEHLKRYPHVLPTYRYEVAEALIEELAEKIIAPAEAKVIEMAPK